MSNRNRRVVVAPFQEAVVSPAQQSFWKRLTYEQLLSLSDYSLETRASLFSSDLQTLEDEFGRFDVSDSSAPQQPLQENQFPLDSEDQGMIMNDRGNWFPSVSQQKTGRERRNQSQRSWFLKDNCVNRYDARRSYNYGYMFGIRTNHYTTLSLAKDRIESLLLQDVIVKGSEETIEQIFDNLISHVCELMLDPFGRRVFQKLLEKCTDEQITRVLDIVIQKPLQFVRVCVDSHGTRAVQHLMRSLCSEEQISRFMATLCHVALLLTKNANANHVILCCFNQFSPSHSRYLLDVIIQNCYQVAIDQHGCCMLQQCITQSSRELSDPLIKEIISNALRLCVNRYGNYMVQYVLELEDCQVTTALSKYLDGNYVQLSYDKYGSHAVQKCLKSREFRSRRIITELLSDIDSLLVNPFGNYVIQTVWIVSEDDVRNVLLYHINRNVPFMRCNIYGRKVLEKLNLWT